MVLTRNMANSQEEIMIIGETVVYLDLSDDEDLVEQLTRPDPPSYDYVMGEVLATENLPSYQELYSDLLTYQDVLDEKFWEEKMKIQKEIENIKNEMNCLYEQYKQYRNLNNKLKKINKKNDDSFIKETVENNIKKQKLNDINNYLDYLCNCKNINRDRRLNK